MNISISAVNHSAIKLTKEPLPAKPHFNSIKTSSIAKKGDELALLLLPLLFVGAPGLPLYIIIGGGYLLLQHIDKRNSASNNRPAIMLYESKPKRKRKKTPALPEPP